MTNDIYTAPVEVDSDGDLILVFPDALLEAMQWREGDTLLWKELDDGTWSLKKREDSDS